MTGPSLSNMLRPLMETPVQAPAQPQPEAPRPGVLPSATPPPPKPTPAPDPRPDLTQDHGLWADLLANAGNIDPNVEGLLHGLRCGGARLQENPGHKLQLARGEIPAAEWEEIKANWLAPNREKIVEALKTTELGTVNEEVAEGEFKPAAGASGQLTFGMSGSRR